MEYKIGVFIVHLGFQELCQLLLMTQNCTLCLVWGQVIVWWVRKKEAKLSDENLGEMTLSNIFVSRPFYMSFEYYALTLLSLVSARCPSPFSCSDCFLSLPFTIIHLDI